MRKHRCIISLRSAISIISSLLCVIMLSSPAQAYELTDDERIELEGAVMAEASTDFYGQALIAECAKNTAELNGWTIAESLEKYGWTKRRVEPSISARWAVSSVFDYNYSPSEFQNITVFYNPSLVNSPYHESQEFILKWKGVKYFRENQYRLEDIIMNNKRRQKITGIINDMNDIIGKLSQIASVIEGVQMEEEEAFDALPEQLQYADQGAVMEAANDNLLDGVSDAEELLDMLKDSLDKAKDVVKDLETARDGE